LFVFPKSLGLPQSDFFRLFSSGYFEVVLAKTGRMIRRIMRLRCKFLIAASVLAVAPLALSAQLLTKSAVSLELAKKIAMRAEAEAVKNKWTMVIAVVDDGGNLVYLERMDGTQLGSIEVAQQKAKTALWFRRPTKTFEDGVAGGRNALLSMSNVIAIEGGLPLTVDGAIVGAIGVSGMKSDQDGIVAQAGTTVLSQP
jgi:glc operon protein GlcG